MSRGCRVMLASLVAVFVTAATCLAGAMYRNDSGAVARAVRIEFSEPAEITSMWPSFPQRDPQGPATVIVLSGGEVPAGGWFSFTWRPQSAGIVQIGWHQSASTAGSPEAAHEDIPWDSTPYFFEYDAYAPLSFWKGESRPIGQALYWGLPGHDVRGLKVHMDKQTVAFQLIFASDTASESEYLYNVRLSRLGEECHIFIDPQARSATFEHRDRDGNWSGGLRLSERLMTAANALTVAVGLSDLPEPFTPALLADWSVQLHIAQGAGEAMEWFSFPGNKSYADHVVWLASVSPIADSKCDADTPAWLYNYVGLGLPRHGEGPFWIPVYLSLPPETPCGESYLLETSGGEEYALDRTGTGIFMTRISVPRLPHRLILRVLRDTTPVSEWLEQYVQNSYQAISIGLSGPLSSRGSSAHLPDNFRVILSPTDVWGTFVYGRHDDTHTRHYVESVLQRITEAGATDVLLASFVGWERIRPLPVLRPIVSGGTVTVSEQDLSRFVAEAHKRGLRVILMYHAVPLPGTEHLVRDLAGPHDHEWVSSFMEQYSDFMITQAEQAARAGVDVLVLNVSDAGVVYRGHEELWSSGMGLLVDQIKETFPGSLAYALSGPEVESILRQDLPLQGLQDIEVFFLYDYLIRGSFLGDSLSDIWLSFSSILKPASEIKGMLGGRPLVLVAMAMSFRSFTDSGYVNVVVLGQDRVQEPDFLVQVRYLEALFRYLGESASFDGVVVGWMHWDDPFGPDLPGGALAQMDLGVSIRNKPAEALIKRWFDGSNEVPPEPLADGAEGDPERTADGSRVTGVVTTTIRARARADECQGWPIMVVSIGSRPVWEVEVDSVEWRVYEGEVVLRPGAYDLCIDFTNDTAVPGVCDRNLFLDWIEIGGERVEVETAEYEAVRQHVLPGLHYLGFWVSAKICLPFTPR